MGSDKEQSRLIAGEHRSGIRKYGLTAVVLWTILVVVMLVWSIHVERNNVLEQARVEARAIWTHNLSYRKWVTEMGGIYVRTERMTPNPYLKSKDRDKRTTDGMALTMANPAYMTKQVFDIIRKENDPPIINRIVSAKYLNPANKPDEWEQKGLHAFAGGSKEVNELVWIGGQQYLRMFRPMLTNPGCLNCHGDQGYKVGDVRGGISVAVPMAPYDKIESASMFHLALIYLLLWGVGIGAIIIFYRRIHGKQMLILESEGKYRELNASLEERVEERTRELEENRQMLMEIVDDLNGKTTELEQANARLLELERLKSMFIASMSHELRTPLNSIIGFSSILHDEWVGPVNAEQKENLAIVLRCGKYLLNLINDVIDVSKIEAGKIESIPEEFDLQDLLDEALSLVKKELEEKGLELQVTACSQRLYTDRRRLLQCVLNLLSNAVKFTERGRITVEVQLVPSPGTGLEEPAVEITVADTGIGIRAEDQLRMFQPFVRLLSAVQANIPGTGLGLYLSRKLASEILHGEIRMTSEYGHGSRFTIKIPVRMP